MTRQVLQGGGKDDSGGQFSTQLKHVIIREGLVYYYKFEL